MPLNRSAKLSGGGLALASGGRGRGIGTPFLTICGSLENGSLVEGGASTGCWPAKRSAKLSAGGAALACSPPLANSRLSSGTIPGGKSNMHHHKPVNAVGDGPERPPAGPPPATPPPLRGF